MQGTIKGIFINVYEGFIKIAEIEKKTEEYYKLLGCECIGIVKRRIGNRWYEIVVDDNGALLDNPRISAVDPHGIPALVGNLFIVKFDGKEDITSLSIDDINYISNFIKSYFTANCFLLTNVHFA